MKAEVLHVLSYFDFFNYAPTLQEIRSSLRIKSSFRELERLLTELVDEDRIVCDGIRYAKQQEILESCRFKRSNSMKQLRAFEKIHRLYTIFPFIRLLGISGSLSMLDADKNDDIDLFVVTSNSTLWLTRCYVLFVTRILSLFNHSIAPKLCWNIFMEEQCLSLPLHKQNEYTAHELIQLKIVYDKSDTAHKLQTDNQWIHDILPNVQINSKRKNIDYKPSWQHKVFKFIDLSLRYFQLLWLSKKGYTATEYESQVWFIQNDFEKKILIPLKKV